MKQAQLSKGRCRLCDNDLQHSFVDLGKSPLCETYLTASELEQGESFYPLDTLVCEQCFLVQVKEYVAPSDIYSDYPYFSSYSQSWLAHAKRYCETVTERFQLNTDSRVIEIASNDGYLLQNFVKQKVQCLGIEPAANVAKVAIQNNVPTTVKFFGCDTAQDVSASFGKADLLIGNNVLAHVPDLRDFIKGMQILLAENGVITMEFPHLMRLMQETQYDTIYHEHFSYLSLLTVQTAFANYGLDIFDVEALPSHGGSLRIYAKHASNQQQAILPSVGAIIEQELEYGLDKIDTYLRFESQVCESKWQLLEFLINAKREGKKVVGYGAPGKGNTLLNYCGIRSDLLEYTVDISPHKQGKFTPGTHIPIYAPEHIMQAQPDYVLILPWNLAKEISTQMADIRKWGGQFVVPIPTVHII